MPVSPRRLSRSFKRQSVPEVTTRELPPITQPKRKRQARSKGFFNHKSILLN